MKLKKILCGVLSCLMVLSLVSCKKDKEPEETDDPLAQIPSGTYHEVETEGTGDKYIVTGRDFRIIYGEDESEESKTLGARTLYNLVHEKTGKRMDIESDFNNPAQEHEILVGNTNREGNVDTSALTYYDYGWTFEDGKLRIYGASADALENAVKRLVEKYYDEENNGVVIAVGTELKATYSYPFRSMNVEDVSVDELTIAQRVGYDAAANEVYKGFGRLCGIKIPIEKYKDTDEQPSGKYIYVGFGETSDVSMLYKIDGGRLYFIGNGLLGEFNQLDGVVKKFFEEQFAGGQTGEFTLKNIEKKSFMVEFDGMKYASADYVEKLNLQFENAKNTILTAESEYKVSGSGKQYYVSNNGDDAKDGLTPQTAWKTIGKVNSASMPAGSVVLFERGGVWNRQGALNMKTGVTYSAYGEGDKPMLSNYVDASLAGDWTKVGDNLYVYSGAYNSASAVYDPSLPGSYITSTSDGSSNDIGNIVFNDGEGWGVKVTKYNDRDGSVKIGTAQTGFGTLTHDGNPNFKDQTGLTQHLEFYHNPSESRVYLYCEGGNPADVFSNIKLVLYGYLVVGSANSSTVDNLALKYTGCHGVNVGNATDFTVRNCEIGYIGGSIQKYDLLGRAHPTRFGEGIQNWADCDGYYILNNYIYQVYDGAVTSQLTVESYRSEVVMQNVEVTGNIFEKNQFSIEFWMGVDEAQRESGKFWFKNHDVSNNMIRKSACGFGSTRYLEVKNGEDIAEGCSMTTHMRWPTHGYENVIYTGNIMWEHKENVIYGMKWDENLHLLEGNIIVQEYGKLFGTIAKDANHANRKEWACDEFYYNAQTLKKLIENGYIGENVFYFTYDK